MSTEVKPTETDARRRALANALDVALFAALYDRRESRDRHLFRVPATQPALGSVRYEALTSAGFAVYDRMSEAARLYLDQH